ncbi:ATP-binding protein [Desulfomicrobium escambiense]|uniref:ATP-binding protein n=1 Tax=Desulfomicrobium escambiense TaxID=29503 RepID=UPI00068516F0|nr:ATP-binding protein [Desulfomicrobium escambiense]
MNDIVIVLALWLAALSVPAHALAAGDDRQGMPPNILVLHSYNPGLSWTDDIHRGLAETLAQSNQTCTITTEYLDAKRFPDPELMAMQAEVIAAHLRTMTFDLVVVSDDAAFSFVLKRRGELFRGIPVVFCGVNNFQNEMLRGEKDVTGVSEIISAQETLETALTLHPDTKDIVIIGGAKSSTDRSNRNKFLRLMPAYASRARFHFWQDIPTPALVEKVAALGPGTILFLNNAIPGLDGRMLDFGPSAALIRANARCPLYGLWDFFLGHGIVGGKLINGTEQGRLAAGMALRILAGTPPAEIPVVKGSANRFLFDYRELARFQISERLLPPDSTVLNRPQSLFEANRRLFTIFGIVVTALLVVIAFLAVIGQIRRQTLRELQRARRKAEEANEAKSLFLAHMSHEIRTPLTGIMGLAELALNNPSSPAVQDYLALIRQSGQNLLHIINDILDFSKVEAGKLVLNPANFQVRKMLDATIALFTPRAREKGIELSLRVDAEMPEMLCGDELRLRQIFFNLIGNAIKFTEQGEVELCLSAATPTGDGQGVVLHFEIRDTGCGIPADKLPTIFDRFTQADHFPTRTHQGTGLGLAIVKQLVEILGGAIEVQSVEGAGSTFFVGIPLEYALHADVEPETETALRNTSGSLSVLVAEDNSINQIFLKRTLEKLGHNPTCAANGQQALDLLHEQSFDCVIMDIQMPLMDGTEATRRIRQDLGLTLPVIALTAHALQGDREKFLAQGFTEYLAKPVAMKDLEQALCAVGEGKAGRQRWSNTDAHGH